MRGCAAGSAKINGRTVPCRSHAVPATPGHSGGFTLVELMVTLGVAAILALIAAPSFSNLIKNNRVSAQAGEISSALAFAHNTAITRGQRVVFGASDSVSGNQFGGGWSIWVDANGNGSKDSDDPVLKVHAALDGNVLSTANSVTSIAFLPGGGLDLTNGSPQILYLCDQQGAVTGSQFTIMASGLVYRDDKHACG